MRSATRKDYDTLTVDGRDLKFNREGRMLIKDEGLARNIQQEYPDELAVTRLRSEERGHSYFFGSMPAMPWHKEEDELEKDNIDDCDGTAVDGDDISDVPDNQEPD